MIISAAVPATEMYAIDFSPTF